MIWLRIVFTMILAVLFMVVVYSISNIPNLSHNGFNRINLKSLRLISSVEIKKGLNGIAGINEGNIYANTLNPGHIYVQSFSAQISHHLFYKVDSLKKKKADDLIVPIVDSKNIYFLNFNNPGILSGTVNDAQMSGSTIQSADFTKAVMGDSSVLFVRRFNVANRDQMFSKYFLLSGKFENEHNFSEVFNDGGISTDGTLNYNKERKLCTYVYYYKNKFLVFNQNLFLIKTIKTIDTLSDTRISVDKTEIVNDSSFTLTNNAPVNMLNICSATFNSDVFILSSVKADNDTADLFERNNVIDIYNIDSGKYSGSFYVPKSIYGNLRDFKIQHDTLIGVYKKGIQCFKISNAGEYK